MLTRRALLVGAAVAALPTTSADGTPYDWRRELRRLERTTESRIGAYAQDVGSGRTVQYRENERFPVLSTFKTVLAGAVLDRSRYCERGLLRKRLSWSKADLVAHSPVTADHVRDGLTVAELCRATITVSDNTAANVLLRQIGGPEGLTAFLRGIGDPTTRLDRWETALNDWSPADLRDTTTPAAMGRTVRELTFGAGLHPADRTRLITWMRGSTTGAHRIRTGVPRTWVVGDEGMTDSYGGANDIAVAYPPAGAPVVIAIYTNRLRPSLPAEESVIARTATTLVRALGRQ